MSQNTQRIRLIGQAGSNQQKWEGYANEFIVNYSYYGLICRIDEGPEFEVTPGIKYRNIQDGVVVPFRKLFFRKPTDDQTTLDVELIISDAVIEDLRAFQVLSQNVTFDHAVVDSATYTAYDLTKFNGQRVEFRADLKNAHEIYLSAVQTPSVGSAGGNMMRLYPGEAPVILNSRSKVWIAKGSSLGYGTNTHPILNVITHY